MTSKRFSFQEILLKIRVGNIDKQVRSVLSQHMKKEIIKIKKGRIQTNASILFKEICASLNDSELKKLEDSGKKIYYFNALVKKYQKKQS